MASILDLRKRVCFPNLYWKYETHSSSCEEMQNIFKAHDYILRYGQTRSQSILEKP